MRRPALLIAGMLLATGAGLAAASPASAAVSGGSGDSSRWHCHWYNGHDWPDYWDDWFDDGPWNARRYDNDNRRRYCHSHRHGHWHGNGHVSIGIGSGGIGVHVGGGGH
jgi:hypothetical protein